MNIRRAFGPGRVQIFYHLVLAVVINRYSLISGAPQGAWPAKGAPSTSPLPPPDLPSIGGGPPNRRPPRALQEPFKRLSAAITQLIGNLIPFYIDFDSQKATLGPQKQRIIQKKTILFAEITFSARVASGTRFGTLPGSVLGAFWPSRWLKPLLEFLLERPRAVQEICFFRS